MARGPNRAGPVPGEPPVSHPFRICAAAAAAVPLVALGVGVARQPAQPAAPPKTLAEWVAAVTDPKNPGGRDDARRALGPDGPFRRDALPALLDALGDATPNPRGVPAPPPAVLYRPRSPRPRGVGPEHAGPTFRTTGFGPRASRDPERGTALRKDVLRRPASKYGTRPLGLHEPPTEG